ncbi:protein FANTASTIC FOUR 1 [Rosa sericea]
MSSTTVCHQELQPCVESLVRLQLVPPRPKLAISEPQEIGKSSDKPSWSFLQSFTTTIQTPKTETETEKVYVHPLVKRSASVLSPKSLAMCTESLGSETGSDASSGDMSFLLQKNDIPLLSLEAEKTQTFSATKQINVETPKLSDSVQALKRLNRSVNGGNNFPPPLTSIGGSNGVQFLPHREGGRLVLKAVPVTSPANYFKVERGDGRLRLQLLRDMTLNSDINEEVEDAEEEEDEVVREEEVVEEIMEVETETCREEEEEEMEVEEKSGGYWETEEEDMEGNSGSVVGETGMEKKLPSRCKESRRGNNKMVMNWPPESFWVAT